MLPFASETTAPAVSSRRLAQRREHTRIRENAQRAQLLDLQMPCRTARRQHRYDAILARTVARVAPITVNHHDFLLAYVE
jgi:hypothetical protein